MRCPMREPTASPSRSLELLAGAFVNAATEELPGTSEITATATRIDGSAILTATSAAGSRSIRSSS